MALSDPPDSEGAEPGAHPDSQHGHSALLPSACQHSVPPKRPQGESASDLEAPAAGSGFDEGACVLQKARTQCLWNQALSAAAILGKVRLARLHIYCFNTDPVHACTTTLLVHHEFQN